MKLQKVTKSRSNELDTANNLPIVGENGMSRSGLRIRSNVQSGKAPGVGDSRDDNK